MPTYEYECKDCGDLSEHFKSMSESPKTKCEKCGGKIIRLVGAGAGLIFKGSGFYITDYKKGHSSPTDNKSSESKGSDGNGKKSDEGSSSSKPAETSKSETKPAAKPAE